MCLYLHGCGEGSWPGADHGEAHVLVLEGAPGCQGDGSATCSNILGPVIQIDTCQEHIRNCCLKN